MELGKTQAERELTKKLAAGLIQREVMEPMGINGWQQGAPPSPTQAAITIAERARAAGEPEEKIAAFLADRGIKYTPPAGGQPAKTEGAPVSAPTPAPATSGQPAPVAPAPAPAAPAKTDTPDNDLAARANSVLAEFEALKGPDGKVMGKYATLSEALKGAGHLMNMTKSVLQENDQLKQRLAAPNAGVVAPPAAVPAAAPAIQPFVPTSRPELEMAKARLEKVLTKVNGSDTGFDGDSAREFAEATREVAKQEALAVAAEQRERDEHARKTTQQRWDAVNQYMAERYPNSLNVNADEFSLFLSLNPLLAEALGALRAQGREQRAAELGFLEFEKSRGGAVLPGGMSRAEAERKEIDLSERERVRIEARDAALKDASIVHGSAGGSSAVESPGITGPSQEDINTLVGRMHHEGDGPGSRAGSEWRKAVIIRNLPPELFGPQMR